MKTRIPELRRERKLSQEELARAVGTTRHYFGLTIEEVFDFSELEGEVRRGRV